MNIHAPVLLDEAIKGLDIKKSGIYIDCTFGRGGHSKQILDCLNEDGRLIAFDQDDDAQSYFDENFDDPRLKFFKKNFSELAQVVKDLDLNGKIDGVLFDLGVSSPQLDNAERGFSFNKDGPLDMRMDRGNNLTVSQWLTKAKESEIANVIYHYGEEKKSRLIAKKIKEFIENKPIETTFELSNIIKTVVKSNQKKHPATRTFQALRIFINKELEILESTLEELIQVLSIHGRICIISFHSLEDRIVKKFIQKNSRPSPIPKGMPIQNNEETISLKNLGKLFPTQSEINSNIRSRSAILRVAEKC